MNDIEGQLGATTNIGEQPLDAVSQSFKHVQHGASALRRQEAELDSKCSCQIRSGHGSGMHHDPLRFI